MIFSQHNWFKGTKFTGLSRSDRGWGWGGRPHFSTVTHYQTQLASSPKTARSNLLFKTMGKEENRECMNKHKQHPLWVDFIGFAKFQSGHLHQTPFYRLRRIESHISSAEMVLRWKSRPTCLPIHTFFQLPPQGYCPPLAQAYCPGKGSFPAHTWSWVPHHCPILQS